MPNQREIDLIINLRNATKNTSEAKKLENSIRSLHKLAEKVNKTLGSEIATKQMNFLKKAIDGATGSLGKFLKGKDTKFKNLQKGIRFVLDIINKLIEASKRSSGELGKLARSNLGKLTSLKDIFTRLQEVTEKLPDKFSKIAESTKKIISSSSSASSALQKKATVIQKVSAQYQNLIDRLYSYRVASKTVISVTNKLEASLRKIQTLGKLKGVSIFEQNIQSTKVFIAELEKLRMKLAEINKESIVGRTSVTKNMILEFRRMSEAINEAQVKTKALTVALEELRKAKTSAEAIENLRNVLKTMGIELGKGVKSFKTFETAVAKAMNKIKTDLKKSEVTWKEVANLYRKSINQMKENLIKFSQTSFKVWAEARGHLEGTVAILDQSEKKVLRLTQAYEKFKAAGQLVKEGVVSLKVAQEAANKVIERASVVIETLGSKYSKNAQMARQMASAFLGIANVSAYLQTRLKTLAVSLVNITRREKVLITASKYLYDSLTLLRQQTALAQERATLFGNEIIKLSARLNLLQRATVKDASAIALLTRRLSLLQIQAKKASVSFNVLNNRFMQAEQKAGDASRAMSRMSSQGFANMIISQAAWMAGFQVIFGTLDKFKAALGAVAETQLAVSRAMRTIRSDLLSQSEIYEKLTDIINEMRMLIGASASETGEALYQLGSAGLFLKESLAALEPTMHTIVGAEADMEQITNLVAGIYNNFSHQIVKVDGRVTTISNTFDEYNTKLVESASLTEKFTLINDQLIRTFDAHQAEMAQIRDGLKFMAQSAKVANISLTEQLGILATLHDHLIKAGAAGRGMRVIISRISKEAKEFSKAFDIKIDLSAPLDMMDILSQLSVKIKDQTLSVDKLGQFFKKLGLRGVEPLLVLIQYFDELNRNIEDIDKNSRGAAKAMALIRLDNIGDQANIAAGKIEVLMKNGLEPLASLAITVVRAFNFVSEMFLDVNKAMGGFLGTIIKFVGFMGLITGVAVVFRNLGGVVKWIQGVFIHLAISMKNFGTSVFAVDKEAKTLGATLSGLGASFVKYTGSVRAATTAQYHITKSLEGTSRAAAVTQASVAGLSKAWAMLSSIMKTMVWVIVIIALEKLVSWILNYTNRVKELTKALKSDAATQKENLSSLIDLREKMIGTIESTGEWTMQLKLLATQLGINSEEYSSASDAMEEMKKSLDEIIQKQKEMADASKMEFVRQEFENLSTTVKVSALAFSQVAAQIDYFGNGMDLLKDKINAGNERIVILNRTLDFLKANPAPADLIQKFKEMGSVAKEQLEVIRKMIDGWNDERVAQGRVAIATEDHKQKVEELIKGLREAQEVVEAAVKENKKQAKALAKLDKELVRIENSYRRTMASVKSWKESLKDSELTIGENERALKNYNTMISVTEQVLSRAKNKFKEFGDAVEIARNVLGRLSQDKAIVDFDHKLEKTKETLSRLENSFLDFDKTINKKPFLKLLKDLEKLQKTGFKILDQLYKRLISIKDILVKLEGMKLDIKTEKTNRNLEESQRIVDRSKERLDKLRESGTKNSYALERASRKYRDALKDQQKRQREVVNEAQKQINKSKEIIEAQQKVANSESATVEERRKALEKIEKALGKQKDQYQKILDANKAVDAAKRKLLEEDLKRGRISQADFDRRMNAQDGRYETQRKAINKAMDQIANKREKTLEKLGPLYEKEFKKVEIKIKEVLDKMAEIQKLASRGINLNSSSIDAAIQKADELHENLKRPVEKKVKIIVEGGEKVPSGSYWGGLIKRAQGGMVPARVTAGEGFIPPGQTQNNLSSLNSLNRGSISSRIPSSIGTFKGPGGVDNIHTYLPVGSYIISKRGMEAYERSANQGAQTFQEGGEVAEIESPAVLSSMAEESIGSFTIVVEKGGTTKEFPVTGKISILKGLRDELEEDKLTRLH